MVYMREGGFKAFGECVSSLREGSRGGRSLCSFPTGRWIYIALRAAAHHNCCDFGQACWRHPLNRCVLEFALRFYVRYLQRIQNTDYVFHPDQVLTDPRRVVTGDTQGKPKVHCINGKPPG